MIKRAFDLIFSLIGLLVLLPFLFFIAIIIKIDSRGPILFIQSRVGKNNHDFNIFKFRTMINAPKKNSFLTLGNSDTRITKFGYFLRKYKIDELPQLINVLKGDMSFVGPRPELRYFVNFYSEEDLKVLQVRPGITGLASLKFRNEVELLKDIENPETYFIKTIIPQKLKLNKEYIEKRSFFFDLKLIGLTILKVFNI